MVETILNVPNLMLDIRNNSNDTALDIALLTGKKSNFDILLKKTIQTRKINTLNKRGLCYLSLAIMMSEIDFVKHMIEDLSFDPNDNGDFEEENSELHNFPLHQAIICQRTEMIKYLLSLSSINVNIQDEKKNGDSSLHIACKLLNFQAVCLLIESPKIDINLKNNDGDNCLMGMIRQSNDSPYESQSIKARYIQIFFQIATQKKFNLNEKGKNGETILHLIRNNTDMLVKLSQLKLNNIDPNIENDFGKTVIDLLLEEYSPKYLNVCTLICFENFRFSEKLLHSEAVFFILQKMPSFELFRIFVKNGLDLNSVSKSGIFNNVFFLSLLN